jgi:hypothetical protein
MRAMVLVSTVLGFGLLFAGVGVSPSWPEAVLAVANGGTATDPVEGTEVDAACVYRPCVHAGVPTATADIHCFAPPYGCPFLWESYGGSHLHLEHLGTGQTCEATFPPPAGWCKFTQAGWVRFTLTATGSPSESVITFH